MCNGEFTRGLQDAQWLDRLDSAPCTGEGWVRLDLPLEHLVYGRVGNVMLHWRPRCELCTQTRQKCAHLV